MFVGRAGTMMASKKRAKLKIGSRSDKYRVDDIEDQIPKNRKNDEHLVLGSFPLGVWSSGLLIIAGSIFLLVNLLKGDKSDIKGFHEGYWWQYFVTIMIFIVGLSFIFAVKREKIELDKVDNTIQLVRKNIFCFQKVWQRPLNAIDQIYIAKRGRDSIMNKTLHYKIVLCFNDSGNFIYNIKLIGPNMEILETNSLRKSKVRVSQIKRFLNLKNILSDLRIVDESTK